MVVSDMSDLIARADRGLAKDMCEGFCKKSRAMEMGVMGRGFRAFKA